MIKYYPFFISFPALIFKMQKTIFIIIMAISEKTEKTPKTPKPPKLTKPPKTADTQPAIT